MSNKHYPYLADKKKKTQIICETCKKKSDGFKLEWQVSWFRGDDEFELICKDCEKTREEKERIVEKKRADYEAFLRRQYEREQKALMKKLEAKYEVKYLTPYQWRVNGIIDIFPTNQRYHNIKTQKRGSYGDLLDFLDKRL